MVGFAGYSRFFVLGMARSGLAVSLLLARDGKRVAVFDDDAAVLEKFRASEAARAYPSIEVISKDRAVAVAAASDCVVVSPGVASEHAVLAAARESRVPVMGEIEAAYRYTRARIVGVTGTNGKSTTVGVIGDILKAGGVDAVVAGNVGTPLADVLRERDPDTLVLELSSFQLDTIDRFRVDVAVLLNVTPDHLDRYHHSFDEYAASKARILNRAGAETYYVYNAEDAVAAALAETHAGPAVPFSSRRRLDTGVYFDGEAIVRSWKGTREAVIRRSEFTPVGVHNLENALASVAAVIPFEISLDAMRKALRGYRPLPHRMELVRVVDGVAYINDSKATNVDATAKSLASIDGPVIVILGGRDKEGDFASLLPHLKTTRRAVLIGEARPVIARALSGKVEMSEATDMADAVRTARASAQPGDTVLLAPACASFDMFKNYQERGEVFRASVNSL
ncbi:MAG TPA: UDP-N-acetylmuramoyl-L-alanine--D-glutamate ligase [Candidatus Krumholzibacteria bacterium]|nr:UDP-N-acetylmuramoyl-L-alanine--D-glutamate ligase [Candidatus Krumholzibacteria bacterium]